MRRASLGLALSLAACGDASTAPLRLELDPAPEHRAVIVSAGSATSGPLVAWDLESGPAPALQVALGESPVPVIALFYEVELSALGLTPGDLRRSPSGAALPTPAAIATTSAGGGVAPGWVDLNTVPAALADVRVEVQNPCVPLEAGFAPLPFTAAVWGVNPAGPEHAWVLQDGGTLWRVGTDGGASELARGLPSGATLSTAGGLWIGGHGRLVRVAIDGARAQVVETLDVPGGGRIERLAAPAGSERPRFALTDDRRLLAIEADAVREVAAVAEDVDDVGGLTVLPDGHALFGFEKSLVAYRWTGAELRLESVPANALDSGLTAFGYWPDFGAAIGSATGELIVRPNGADAWVRLDGAPFTLDVEGIIRFDEGLLYTDERGVLVQYAPGFGFCEAVLPPRASKAEGRRIATDGATVWTAGQEPDLASASEVFWYRRKGR